MKKKSTTLSRSSRKSRSVTSGRYSSLRGTSRFPKDFSVVLTIVCLVLSLATFSLVIFCSLPGTNWFEFDYAEGPVPHRTENRSYVWERFPKDYRYWTFWRDELIFLIASALSASLLCICLVIASVSSSFGGFSHGASSALRVSIALLGFSSFLCVTGSCAYYAGRHQRCVRDCEMPGTADMPWCHRFWGSDAFGNRGRPAIGWYLILVASVISLVSCILGFFVKPKKHYLAL